jgi:hypothetical protein
VFCLSALDSAVEESAAEELPEAEELPDLLELSLEEELSPQAVSIDPTMQRLSAPASTLLRFAIIISSLNLHYIELSYGGIAVKY